MSKMIGAKRKRGDEDDESCYKKSFDQDTSEKATRLQDLQQSVSKCGIYSMVPLTIDAVSLKEAVYIGCPCCKRRVYRESNGAVSCSFHGVQETPTYFYRLRVKLLEVDTGAILWLSLFDEIMTQFIQIDACEFINMNEGEQREALKEMLGASVQFTIKKSKRDSYTNYDAVSVPRASCEMLTLS